MKHIPIGIYRDANNPMPPVRASNFSTDKYDGIEVRADGKKGLVIILRSKQVTPYPWKVIFGHSEVFFPSLEKAQEFCNTRGYHPVKA